jgi:mono/diheme cytochrome c family protein
MLRAIIALWALALSSAATLWAAGVARDVTEGRVLYTRYCASCHGLAADGHGPVAPVLRRSPSDLRRLAGRYGEPLVADGLARYIDGREQVAAHGSREMPVWGERFALPEPEASGRAPAVDSRIARIVAYLATIQLPRR